MSTPIGDNWKSRNATNAIKQHMLPMVCFNLDHIRPFLRDYQSAYPKRLDELSLLSKLSPDDWKAVAKQFKCTEWHHYGQAAQRVGFWDMWAVAEVVLSVCRSSSGKYQIQLLKEQQQKYFKQYRKKANQLNAGRCVRLIMFKYESDKGEIYAPGILKESYRGHKNSHRHAEVFYMDYLLAGKFHKNDIVHYLSAEDTSVKYRFAIITTITTIDPESISRLSRFKYHNFKKLLDYASSQNWKISSSPSFIKQKLQYVGPPENFHNQKDLSN